MAAVDGRRDVFPNLFSLYSLFSGRPIFWVLSPAVLPVFPSGRRASPGRRGSSGFGLGGQAAEEAIVRMVEAEDALEGARSEAKRLRTHLTTAESKLKVR